MSLCLLCLQEAISFQHLKNDSILGIKPTNNLLVKTLIDMSITRQAKVQDTFNLMPKKNQKTLSHRIMESQEQETTLTNYQVINLNTTLCVKTLLNNLSSKNRSSLNHPRPKESCTIMIPMIRTFCSLRVTSQPSLPARKMASLYLMLRILIKAL